MLHYDFPGVSDGKAPSYNARDPGLIPWSGRSPGKGNGNPLQYSCLENPMDGGAWCATVQGVAKSRTQLSYFTHSLSGEGNWGIKRTKAQTEQMDSSSADLGKVC